MTHRYLTVPLLSFLLLASIAWAVDEYKSGILWPEPKVVEPGHDGGPPSDAIVLFDGKDLSAFKGGDQWTIADGVAIANKGGLTSKQAFGDCQLHVEFATPEKVSGKGQGRGNSGIYLMGEYEVQILDSHDNPTYFDGQCASIYKQSPPMVNASRKPGEWQTYDILFTAPRFAADGKVEKPGAVTVLHNRVCVHNHFVLEGTTSYTEPPRYRKHAEKLPFSIQFHGNPVKFRNIWIREISQLIGKPPGQNPEATKPEATKPEATKPEAAKPEEKKPQGKQPKEKKPDDAKPKDAKEKEATDKAQTITDKN